MALNLQSLSNERPWFQQNRTSGIMHGALVPLSRASAAHKDTEHSVGSCCVWCSPPHFLLLLYSALPLEATIGLESEREIEQRGQPEPWAGTSTWVCVLWMSWAEEKKNIFIFTDVPFFTVTKLLLMLKARWVLKVKRALWVFCFTTYHGKLYHHVITSSSSHLWVTSCWLEQGCNEAVL